MNEMRGATIVFACCLFLSGQAGASFARSSAAIDGLTILPARAIATAVLSEPLAKAWSDAYWLANAYPEEFGYPWADDSSGALVLSVTGPAGAGRAAGWIAGGTDIAGAAKSIALPAPNVVTRSRAVGMSFQALERIKDDATLLAKAGVVDADAIYETGPDFENNRVIITVSRQSDALFAALAARYGTSTIAIRVEPNRPMSSPTYGGRNNDTSPFLGGAQIQTPGFTCTSGFAWNAGGIGNAMISAGHCASTGGSIYTLGGSYFMGSVTPSTEENWTAGTGTVYLSGQSVNRGDASMIRITSGRSADPAMYQGLNGSSSWATVKEMWYRSPAVNDNFCTGGHVSGERCGWRVGSFGINHQYPSTGEWVRNIVEGYKANDGNCTVNGDSGGPTYTIRPDLGIAAKGFISGNGFIPFQCLVYFTDIWQVYFGWPGTLRLG